MTSTAAWDRAGVPRPRPGGARRLPRRAGRAARPARRRRRPAARRGARRRCPAASASGRRSATGATAPSRADDAGRRGRAWSGPAPSLELLHASALVHDDYMDASDTRRGRPGDPPGFEREHRGDGWRGDPEQYGAAAAILLGDLLLSWSDELLRRCGLPLERVVAGARRLRPAAAREVIAGQFLDVSVQARGARRRRRRDDGAALQVREVLHRAAAAHRRRAGRRRRRRTLARARRAFGLPLGEAFQLRDDLLGVFGDPATTGKPAGDDLIEGKRTVLVALALDARRRPRTPRGSTPRSAPPLDGRRGRASCAGSSTPPAPTPQVEQVIERARRPARWTALDAAPVATPARDVLRELAAAATRPRSSDPSGRRSQASCEAGSSGRRRRGPSPRSSTANGPPRSALTRPPSTRSATRNAARRCRASGPQPSQSSTRPRCRRRVDVAEAVGERVEVLAVVVGEGERLADRREELGLGPRRASRRRGRSCQPACSTVCRTSLVPPKAAACPAG